MTKKAMNYVSPELEVLVTTVENGFTLSGSVEDYKDGGDIEW